MSCTLFVFVQFVLGTESVDENYEIGCEECGDASKLYPKTYFSKDPSDLTFKNFSVKKELGYLGKGHFSTVRKAILSTGEEVAIKSFKIYKNETLVREINILRALQDVPNTVKILGISGNVTHPNVFYSYHSSTDNGYYKYMKEEDFKWWLKTCLETLKMIHERGVIHRDFRLANILTDFNERRLAIVDFGLSSFYWQNKKLSPNVGCIRIKAPELVMRLTRYNCSIDIWGLGLSILDIVLRVRNALDSKNNDDLIKMYTRMFGTSEWNIFASNYNKSRVLSDTFDSDVFRFAYPGNEHLLTPELYELMKKMLTLDPKKRITAKDALRDPYFSK